MRAGRASRTAEQVCIARAIAHAQRSVERFDDPTAFELLSHDAREQVVAARSTIMQGGLRQRAVRSYMLRLAYVMAVRTVAIDDAIRGVRSPQLVVLGAGLDGRAWRMPELRDTVVFEVDHPDSQRDKRARITTLTQTAREVRFVPVDFARDDLGAALASAGHDPALPTTWIWEGVVMYLRPEEVDATLAAIASRSAAGSRAVVLYHGPALVLHAVGLALRAIGEPLRSTFTPAAMRALLTKHGFTVARDENLPELARTLSPDLAGAARPVAHMRLATADR